MPLQSPYDAPTGDSYAAAYSVVVEAIVNFALQTMTATVATYRDAEAYALGRAPVSVRQFVWGASDFGGDVGAGILSGLVDLQNALLDRAEFAGAVIVDTPVAAPPPPDQVAAVLGTEAVAGTLPDPAGAVVDLAPAVDPDHVNVEPPPEEGP